MRIYFVRRRPPISVEGAREALQPEAGLGHGARPFQALFTPQHPPTLHATSTRSLLQASLHLSLAHILCELRRARAHA